jgi:haloalkane dehalogenase
MRHFFAGPMRRRGDLVGYSSLPFAEKKFLEIKGRRMAYIDEGNGAPIVFQHGNPASSYIWRNIMPYCFGSGRLIACDLIGMGDSEKLPNSGPRSYSYVEHRSFLFALWEELGLGKDVVLVLHDWGTVLGFDWANQNRSRVQGIAYMEGIPMPFQWDDFPVGVRVAFRALRSAAGEKMVLRGNLFVEQVLRRAVLRTLCDAEMEEYRRPFLTPGEGRRPTLSWPRQVPFDEEPEEVVKVVTDYGEWLQQSAVPKLWVHGNPGAVERERVRAFCRTWPNQTEVTVKGIHYLQEDSPIEIGEALAKFIRGLRGN